MLEAYFKNKKNKRVLRIFKPKSTEEILIAFCDKYGIEYSDDLDFIAIVKKALQNCKKEKHKYICDQKYEMAAATRDDEKLLMAYLGWVEGDRNMDEYVSPPPSYL